MLSLLFPVATCYGRSSLLLSADLEGPLEPGAALSLLTAGAGAPLLLAGLAQQLLVALLPDVLLALLLLLLDGLVDALGARLPLLRALLLGVLLALDRLLQQLLIVPDLLALGSPPRR